MVNSMDEHFGLLLTIIGLVTINLIVVAFGYGRLTEAVSELKRRLVEVEGVIKDFFRIHGPR